MRKERPHPEPLLIVDGVNALACRDLDTGPWCQPFPSSSLASPLLSLDSWSELGWTWREEAWVAVIALLCGFGYVTHHLCMSVFSSAKGGQ